MNDIKVFGKICLMKIREKTWTSFNLKHLPLVISFDRWNLSSTGYIYTYMFRASRMTTKLHHIIRGEYTEHLDRNPLNNLDRNLGDYDRSRNAINAHYSHTNHGRCLVFRKDIEKWRTQITIKGKRIRKQFDTKEQAIQYLENTKYLESLKLLPYLTLDDVGSQLAFGLLRQFLLRHVENLSIS